MYIWIRTSVYIKLNKTLSNISWEYPLMDRPKLEKSKPLANVK